MKNFKSLLFEPLFRVNVLENDKGNEKSLDIKTEPKKYSSKLILVVVAVVAVVIIAALAYVFLGPQGGFLGETQDSQKEWYFKGAYANYEGSTTYLFLTVDFSMRLEIVDFNSTHVKTLYDIKLQSGSLGSLFNEQETNWAPKEKLGTFAWEEMEGYTLGSTYEDHVYIEGLGTKYCKIYEFTQTDIESGDMTMTVYVDPEIMWPLKLSLDLTTENENILFDINLTDTNIPELI
jgi:hypothetical protein